MRNSCKKGNWKVRKLQLLLSWLDLMLVLNLLRNHLLDLRVWLGECFLHLPLRSATAWLLQRSLKGRVGFVHWEVNLDWLNGLVLQVD